MNQFPVVSGNLQTQAEREAASGYYDRGNGVFFVAGPNRGELRLHEVADHLSTFRRDHPDLKIVETIQDHRLGAGLTGLILITEPAEKTVESGK